MNSTKSLVLSLLCLIFFNSLLWSQNDVPPKMEWDRFTVDELSMKSWSLDTTAEAVVLGHFGELFMTPVENHLGFEMVVHKRLKIFKKSGLDRANIEIPYYSKDGQQFVKLNRAQIITPNGKKIPVDSKSIFREKYSDMYSIVKFTFPNVEVGSILEYEYLFTSQYITHLREWYFQEDIPTKASLFKINIESRFEYNFLFQGEQNMKATKPNYQNTGTVSSAQRTLMSFYVNNLSGLRKESFISSMDNYYTRLRFQLASAYLDGGAKETILPDWNGSVNTLLEQDWLGKKFLKKSQYNKVWEVVKPLINPTDSADVKIKTIYNWVNTHVFWNEHLGKAADKSGNELLEKAKGNSASINLLFIALLREAGFDANPLLISTRSNEKAYIQFPIVDQYNQLITYIDKGNSQSIITDAGNPLRPLGLLRLDDLNDYAWLLKKKNSKILNIVAPLSEKIVSADMNLTENGEGQGQVSYQYKNHFALDEREKWFKADTTKVNETVLKKKADWIVSASHNENLTDVEQPYKTQFALQTPNAASANGAFLYLKPILESDWETNPFKLKERLYPIEFPYPMGESYSANWTIPKGYKIEEVPQNLNLSIQSGQMTFNYAITQSEGKINIRTKIYIRRATFDAKYYEAIKDFFAQIAAKLEEPIVLKKL